MACKLDSIGLFFVDKKIHSRQELLRLNSLSIYYTQERITEFLLPLLNHSTPASLRLLDWFVVNYAKKHGSSVSLENGVIYNVHSGYESWLATFRRKLFDPFRRGSHIFFLSDNKTLVHTTIAQLNFCMWCATHGIFRALREQHTDVEADMNSTLASARADRASGVRRKRSKLVRNNEVRSIRITQKKRRFVFEDNEKQEKKDHI